MVVVVVEGGVWCCCVNEVRGANWRARAAGPYEYILVEAF